MFLIPQSGARQTAQYPTYDIPPALTLLPTDSLGVAPPVISAGKLAAMLLNGALASKPFQQHRPCATFRPPSDFVVSKLAHVHSEQIRLRSASE